MKWWISRHSISLKLFFGVFLVVTRDKSCKFHPFLFCWHVSYRTCAFCKASSDWLQLPLAFVMKWSSPRHSISLFCHEIVQPQIYICHVSYRTCAFCKASSDWLQLPLAALHINRHGVTSKIRLAMSSVKMSNNKIKMDEICRICHESLPKKHRRTIFGDTFSVFNIISSQFSGMSGAWPFHAKSNWYYIWGLIISWQNTLMPCLELDHFMTKETDTNFI
jgi:hypothetical protein